MPHVPCYFRFYKTCYTMQHTVCVCLHNVHGNIAQNRPKAVIILHQNLIQTALYRWLDVRSEGFQPLTLILDGGRRISGRSYCCVVVIPRLTGGTKKKRRANLHNGFLQPRFINMSEEKAWKRERGERACRFGWDLK